MTTGWFAITDTKFFTYSLWYEAFSELKQIDKTVFYQAREILLAYR